MEKSDKPDDNNNNSNKDKSKKPSGKKQTAPTTPNPQQKRGSGSTREIMQLSVESAIQKVGSSNGNPNNSFVSSSNKPPITKRGENSSKKQSESASTKGSIRRASKLTTVGKNDPLNQSNKKFSSNENLDSNPDPQESNSIQSDIKKNASISQVQKQSSSQNNLNSKTIGNDIQNTQETVTTAGGKSPSKKVKHSQQRLTENASKLSEKKILKNAQTKKKGPVVATSKDKRNSHNDLKSQDQQSNKRSSSQVNERLIISPKSGRKVNSRQGSQSSNNKNLSSKRMKQDSERNGQVEESKVNPVPLLSEDDNTSFQDTDVNKIQPNEEILSTIKDATVELNPPMILKVPSESNQLTSKKNSNITSYANDSSKSNQDTKMDNKKPDLEEQVIDDNSNEDEEQKGSDEDVDPIAGQRESKTNIAEQFRLAMQQNMMNDPIMSNFIPPPEDLIKKTVIDDEPIKTGAPISFIKFNRLLGRERQEKMNPDNKNKTAPDAEGPGAVASANNAPGFQEIAPANTISDYMINAKEANRIVYCRFGEKYISDLEKRKNSNISSLNAPTMSSASYLINIKKLVEEHNIDGEKRDFKSMRSGQMGKTMQMPPQQFYKLTGPEDKTLVFESRFESGNLLASIKVSDEEYDLVLQNDINTNGNTQWYFFRCSNTHAGQKVKFNFLNLAKPDSLYNYGMKILCFSNKIKDEEGVGWHRIGEGINYYQNQYKRDQCRFFRTYYTFTFTHTFEHTDDSCFFAHCFPYTYSDLQEDLSRIDKEPDCQNFYHKGTLTRTLAGNRCDYLTITSKDKDPKSAKAMAKKGVFISARVHPGESNASWMMKGVIEFLVSNTPEAKALRDHFVFKIVPILNPDGVINGNYRCSLAGQDLNRRWKAPSKILHPVNSAVKKLIRSFVKEREIVLYCDLHGHSRRKNIFMYGNNIKEQPHSTRVFPYIMSKLCDYFSFEQSRFSVSRTKDGTARVAMFKELGIANIFTMEASFCGADKGKHKDLHFTTDTLMMAGQRLLEALIVYCKIEIKQGINQMSIKNDGPSYGDFNALTLEKELTQNTKLIKMTMGEEGNSSGSDSEPSADNLEEDEMAKIVPIKKKPLPPKEVKKPVPVKKAVVIKKPQSPQERRRPAMLKEFSKSPTKRPFGYKNAFDRMRRKPEMKDAWTQTTPKSKEQLEKERREHKQRKNANYLLLQQQQQQMMMQKYQQQLQQQNRGQFPNYNSNQGGVEPQHMAGTLGDIAARNHQRQTEMRNQAAKMNQQQPGASLNLMNQSQNNQKPQVNQSFNLNPLLLSQNQFQQNSQAQQNMQQVQMEVGQSPQPQIRIRTDPFKSKPSNDLAKYEQKLVHKHQDGTIIGGPQHGSVAHSLNHRGSNKRLPQIQSSNSQRKNIEMENSEYHHIQRVKTLNQQQFNSFGNYNQDGSQKITMPPNANSANKNLSQSLHQRQVSGQSPSNLQKRQNLQQTQYGQQMINSPIPANHSQNNGRRLVHAPNPGSQSNQQPLSDFGNPNNRPYTDKKPIQSQQNQRQHYHLSVSPNKMNRIPMNNLAGSVALTGNNTSGSTAQNLQLDVQQAGFSSALASLNQQHPQTIQNIREGGNGAQSHGQNSISMFQSQGKINQLGQNTQIMPAQTNNWYIFP